MTVSYDRDADVLYVTFTQLPVGQKPLYVENDQGDVLRLDKTTRQIVGITIPSFMLRSKQNPLTIPEIGPVPFNERAEELVAI